LFHGRRPVTTFRVHAVLTVLNGVALLVLPHDLIACDELLGQASPFVRVELLDDVAGDNLVKSVRKK
jgi:hypothetical protein